MSSMPCLSGMDVLLRTGAESMKRRALVFEPDAVLRSLLSVLLQREALEVVSPIDPHEASRLLEAFSFEVIVIDLGAPEDQGYDLLHRLKAVRPDAMHCLILIASEPDNRSSVGEPDPSLRVLSKPFDMARFGQVIRECLHQKERGPVRVQCLSCEREDEYSTDSEAAARELARGQGWHVVTFVREDQKNRRTKTLFITFCPACATPARH